jgi:hypothetical protein
LQGRSFETALFRRLQVRREMTTSFCDRSFSTELKFGQDNLAFTFGLIPEAFHLENEVVAFIPGAALLVTRARKVIQSE